MYNRKGSIQFSLIIKHQVTELHRHVWELAFVGNFKSIHMIRRANSILGCILIDQTPEKQQN